MWNAKADFIRQDQVGNDDGTPIYGEVVVYQGVKCRVDVEPSQSQEAKESGRTSNKVRKVLLMRAKHQGQSVNIDLRMIVRVGGVDHHILAVVPSGASKPLFIEVTMLEVDPQ